MMMFVMRTGVFQLCIATLFLLDKYAINDWSRIVLSFDYGATKLGCIILVAFETYMMDSICKQITGKGLLGAIRKALGLVRAIKKEKEGLFVVAVLFSALTLGSCDRLKRLTNEATEKHYYHDSTFTYEKETVRPVYIPADSNTSVFALQALLEEGLLSQQNGNWRTEVRYVNGDLIFKTKLDSALILLREYEKRLSSTITKTDEKIEKKVTEKTINYRPFIGAFILFFLGAALMLGWVRIRKTWILQKRRLD